MGGYISDEEREVAEELEVECSQCEGLVPLLDALWAYGPDGDGMVPFCADCFPTYD